MRLRNLTFLAVVMGLLLVNSAAFANQDPCKNMVGACIKLSDDHAIEERSSFDQIWLEAISEAVLERHIDPETVFVNIAPLSVPEPSSLPFTSQHIAPINSTLPNESSSRVLIVTITVPQLMQIGWYVLNSPSEEEFSSQPWMEDGEFAKWAREWDGSADRGNTHYPEDLERFERELPPKYSFFHAIFRNSPGRALASFETNAAFTLGNCTDDASQLLKTIVQASLESEDSLPSFRKLINNNASRLRSVAPDCLRIE